MATPTTSGPVSEISFSGNNEVDSLLGWMKWGGALHTGATVTYSFPTSVANFSVDAGYDPNQEIGQFTPMSEGQKAGVRAALAAWAEVANLNFVEVPDTADEVGDMRFSNSAYVGQAGNFSGWAYMPSPDFALGGDVWVDPTKPYNLQMAPGQWGFEMILHEIGHALGLEHPFGDPNEKPVMPADLDNERYTVMSYTAYAGSGIGAQTPMLYDIAAVQYIYGANMTTRAGNDTYTFSATQEAFKVIWDAGGTDTIDLWNQKYAQVVDLNDGAFSSIGVKNRGGPANGNIGIAFGAIIENAYGGQGSDRIYGNEVGNHLKGNSGNDILDGRGGGDLLEGGMGSDTYYVDSVFDNVLETVIGIPNGGNDTVHSTVDFTLNFNVENLVLKGGSNLTATGNELKNSLTGNDGNNRLDGRAGADTMAGGKGDDTYVVDNAGDKIVELAGGGSDTIESSTTFSIASFAYIENLTLAGAGNFNASGNAMANVIRGNAGNNLIDGGKGADLLIGGAGNDIYLIDSAGDVVSEGAFEGTADEIRATANLISAMVGIETFTYAGRMAWSAVGNDSANRMTAGAANDTVNAMAGDDTVLGLGGNDTLFGGAGNDYIDGGMGNDRMYGGDGNDVYIVNAAGDAIDEQGFASVADEVRASVSINLSILGAGAIENALLTGTAGINATGNNSVNVLVGNNGANVLDGLGGADVMIGGKGSDTYVIDHAGDQAVETIGGSAGGTDLVKASISFSIAALGNIENVTLLGSAAIDATGNGGKNVLTGNDGANRLNGDAGADVMAGGKGDDTYVVDSAGDRVSETITNAKGGGNDTVEASLSFSLVSQANIENLVLTGSGNSIGTGNALNNQMTGNAGANRLDGGLGNDLLDGGLGNDTLIGGKGSDTLHGGQGLDLLTGGDGSDVFDFDSLVEAADIISDFKLGLGGDILNIHDLISGLGLGGSDLFGDGFLAFTQAGSGTVVSIDADGFGGAGAAVTLATLTNALLTQAHSDNYLV